VNLDRNTSSTLIGGKGRAAGPSSLHTMLEGPTEYVSECEMDVNPHGFLPTWYRIDRVSGANEVIGANYAITTPLFKPLFIV
jgi:hypothetical protein